MRFYEISLSIWIGVISGVCAQSVYAGAYETCILPNKGNVSGEVVLSANCIYAGTIVIENSRTTLDCQGAILDGNKKYSNGLLITGRGKKITDVQVKNCVFKNFKGTGVLVTSGIRKNNLSVDRAVNYSLSPSNIKIIAIQVINSGKGGVYFDDYVTDSMLKDSKIEGSAGAGVYLEQASAKITLDGNVFTNNGFRAGRPVREGLAIDSSAHNVIANNRFERNGKGGIFLYKNCGEKSRSVISVTRWQHSNDNKISGNVFYDEPIGVWLASRQSKDLSRWDCGDPSVDPSGKYYADFADANKVIRNKFCRVAVGVRVEGDNNSIEGNGFSVEPSRQIEEPYKNHPKPNGKFSVGNNVMGNYREACQ